jgi:fumarate reductase subunit C
MNAARRTGTYTPFHPKWYRRRMPIFWWLGSRAYTLFIARELTSVFVAYAGLLLLVLVRALARGPEAWAAFLDWLASPAALALHALTFAALVLHTVTWLGLAPAALVLHVRGRRVPGAVPEVRWQFDTGTTQPFSSPAVANGVIYVDETNWSLAYNGSPPACNSANHPLGLPQSGPQQIQCGLDALACGAHPDPLASPTLRFAKTPYTVLS